MSERRNMKRIWAGVAALALSVGVLVGCSSEADTANHNTSAAADNFEVQRRVVFINGITDEYLLTIEGLCSIKDESGGENGTNQLEVTCKVSDGEYKKHFLGLSDNVTYFVEQTEPYAADPFHYRVFFRPESIVPDIDLQTSNDG